MDVEQKPQKKVKQIIPPPVFDTGRSKRCFLDVSYGTLPEHKLDLYLPEAGEGPFPLLIYVHGGGWTFGSKRECALDAVFGATGSGWAITSVDYRLVPDAQFPEFIFDVKTAVRFLRANAEQYLLNPDRFVIVGDSAGAHIALMVGLTADRPEYEGEHFGQAGVSSAVQAVCAMYGPSALDADENAWYRESGLQETRSGPGRGISYARIFGTQSKPLLRLISPVSLVHKDIPPLLLQHGCDDQVVPYQHSAVLAGRVAEVCGEGRCTLRLYEGRSHSDEAFTQPGNCAELLEYLDGIFK